MVSHLQWSLKRFCDNCYGYIRRRNMVFKRTPLLCSGGRLSGSFHKRDRQVASLLHALLVSYISRKRIVPLSVRSHYSNRLMADSTVRKNRPAPYHRYLHFPPRLRLIATVSSPELNGATGWSADLCVNRGWGLAFKSGHSLILNIKLNGSNPRCYYSAESKGSRNSPAAS